MYTYLNPFESVILSRHITPMECARDVGNEEKYYFIAKELLYLRSRQDVYFYSQSTES